MMKKFLGAALILCLSVGLGYAQSWRGKGRVEGSVKDPDGKPVVGASIQLKNVKYGGDLKLTTDKDGKWVAGGIRAGDWYVDISAQGFALKQLSMPISEVNRNKPVDVILDRDAAAMASAQSAAEIAEASAFLSKGNDLFNQGKFPEALAEYQAILAKHPEVQAININIANCYYEMKQPEKAVETLETALAADPASIEIMTRLGNLYAESGNLEKALAIFGKIDQTAIKNPVTFYNIAVLLFNSGKTNDSLGYLQKAIAVDPNFADGYWQMGLCYANLGDLPKAKEAFTKFLQLAPDSPNAPAAQNILKSL